MRLRSPVGRLGLVLSLTLIGGFAGFLYGVRVPPRYTARAYVVATGTDPVTYAQAYGRVATSVVPLGGATATASPGTPVIEITAHARSAAHAAATADAAARALAAYAASREATLPVTLSVLAPAAVPAHPSSFAPWCELVIGTSAGLLAGAVAALLTLRRPARPSFDDPAEIEGHLRVWRARYGPRSVTAYRGAGDLTEPPDRGEPFDPAD